MITTNHSDFRKKMREYLDRIDENREILVINRPGGKSSVVQSMEDYQSLKETAYLLSSPANANRLAESIEQARNGEVVEIDLSDLE